MVDNWKNRFFKEWRLWVHWESEVTSIDCFDVTFSCVFFDICETYYDLKWTRTDACDYESALGIIEETFGSEGFYLYPVFASECSIPYQLYTYVYETMFTVYILAVDNRYYPVVTYDSFDKCFLFILQNVIVYGHSLNRYKVCHDDFYILFHK